MDIGITKTGSIPKKLNILVYGRPGTWKTCFGGTGEPRFKTLFVSAESGLLSLEEQAKRQGIKEYDVKRIEKFSDLRHTYDYLRNANHGYQLVVMDSGTEIQKVCMDEILATTNEKGQLHPLDKEGKPVNPPRERAVMSDWGYLNTKMTALIRGFRDLPNTSFILTALETIDKNESTGEERVIPLFQGGIKDVIAGYFDEVFYAFGSERDLGDGKKETRSRLMTRNNGRIQGKDRSGKLPLVVEPDFCKIYDMIFATEEKKENTK